MRRCVRRRGAGGQRELPHHVWNGQRRTCDTQKLARNVLCDGGFEPSSQKPCSGIAPRALRLKLLEDASDDREAGAEKRHRCGSFGDWSIVLFDCELFRVRNLDYPISIPDRDREKRMR